MQDKSPTKHPANSESSAPNAAAIEPIATIFSAESLPPAIPDAAPQETTVIKSTPIVATIELSGKSDRLQFLEHHKKSFINLLAYQIRSQTETFATYLNDPEKHLNSKNLTPVMEKIFLDQLDEEFKERARLEALTLSYHDKKIEYEKDKGSLLLQFKIRILRDKALKAHQDFENQEKYLMNMKGQFEKGAGGTLNTQVTDFFNKAIKQKINREKGHYVKTHITGITQALSWSFKESWQWNKDKAKNFWGFLSDIYVKDKAGSYVSSNKDEKGNLMPNSIKEIDKNGKPRYNAPRKISALKVIGRVVAGFAIVAAITGIVVGVVAATHGLGVVAAPAAIAAPALASTLIGTSTGMGISAGAIAGITAGIAAVAAIGTFIGVKLQKMSDKKKNKDKRGFRAKHNADLSPSLLTSTQVNLAPRAVMTQEQHKASQKVLVERFCETTELSSSPNQSGRLKNDRRKSSDKAEPKTAKTAPSSHLSKP